MRIKLPVFFLIVLMFLSVAQASAKEFVIGITSVPLNLNPLFASDANSQNINRLTHLSLIDFNQKMETTCLACERFSEKIGMKEHRATFELRSNLNFWDNSQVTSIDVYNSWKYFTDPQNKSVHRPAFKNIKDILILSDKKIEIIFSKFSTENITNLALLKLIKLDKDKKIIGSGKYIVRDKEPLQVILENTKNKNLLKFKVIKDETTLALKMLKGEIDISLGGISPRKNKWLKTKLRNYSFHQVPGTNYKYISFNHRSKYFKRFPIRRAISKLIPRRDILKYKLHGTAVLSEGLFSPSFSKFFQNSQVFNYDPKGAQSIFVEEGFVKKEKYWEKGNKILEIEWKVSNNKSVIEMANVIKDIFEQNGVKVNLVVQEWGTFMKNVKKGRFDMIMGQWIGFTGQDMMKFIWHSDSIPPHGANRGHYKNDKFDNLINKATGMLDPIKRINTYKQAQREAEEDLAYIGLWHPNITWVAHSCISGLKVYPNGGFLGLKNLVWKCVK